MGLMHDIGLLPNVLVSTGASTAAAPLKLGHKTYK
jgi:hypothetical protein